MSHVSYLDPRLKPSASVPADFKFPSEFLEYLLFEEIERRADPDAKTLEFLWPSEVEELEEVTEKVLNDYNLVHESATESYFVPFARDNGDRIWYFGSTGIYMVDLGWNAWCPIKEAQSSFIEFVAWARSGHFPPLEPWGPRNGHAQKS